MRKVVVFALLGILTVSTAGCVVVLGADDSSCCRRVVEIDGELYVVDRETRRAKRIDSESQAEVESTTKTEITTEED